MDFGAVVDRLSSDAETTSDQTEFIRTQADQVSKEVSTGNYRIIDLIKGMNTVLTSSSHDIRSRGVDLLVQVITKLPEDHLTEREIETLTEFICLRLIDHKSMEHAALKCLLYFADCDNKPPKFNKQIMEFIKEKANIHKMEAKKRHRVYELLKKFVLEKKKKTNTLTGEFIYSLVTILEGENNPENLMLCFGMMAFILRNFDNLEPYLDDIFEWLSAYYPVDYTPVIERGGEANSSIIQRSDLVDALYECFYANDLNADNLQTLLLEKLDSNVLSSQLESLECLIMCYEKPFPLFSITKFNSTLWTAIRMNCLKKIESVDPKLLDASLRTLTSLSKRLLEDKEMFSTFLSDLYDELAIAFRKPEMELFEPAARLLTHVVLPSITGFNFVLNKMLPITLNALEANELRPLPGIDYIFKHFLSEHPRAKLESSLDENITKLAVKMVDLIESTQNHSCIAILESLIRQEVNLDEQSLVNIIGALQAQQGKSTMDIEKCLALICFHYKQFRLISDTDISSCDLDTVIKLVYNFESKSIDLSKFSVYLRLLKLACIDSSANQLDSLDQLVLNDALLRLREILLKISPDIQTVEKSAFIHAAVLNKLQAKNANQISMSIFSSKYCQGLISTETDQDSHVAQNVYLPHIRWIFKSLVLRNHPLATPLINLILNCIVSEKVDCDLAYEAAKTFKFVLVDDELLEKGCHYQVFTLYKQKFYMQTSKEIRLRFEQMQGANADLVNIKKSLLIYSIASQLANLPLAVFRRDQEWLVRQLLRSLSAVQPSIVDSTSEQKTGNDEKVEASASIVHQIYGCLESLIRKDCDDVLVSFLPSIVELNLKNAQTAKSMEVRRQALICLAKVAASFKDSDLLVYRASTLDKLRPCLADKKRLVRQAAGEARLRWTLIGQPIGST